MEILFLFGGVFIGSFVTSVFFRKSAIGTLRMDCSDNEPYIFLELPPQNMRRITQRPIVTFRVDLSQK